MKFQTRVNTMHSLESGAGLIEGDEQKLGVELDVCYSAGGSIV